MFMTEFFSILCCANVTIAWYISFTTCNLNLFHMYIGVYVHVTFLIVVFLERLSLFRIYNKHFTISMSISFKIFKRSFLPKSVEHLKKM